jgi:hypothetical protein
VRVERNHVLLGPLKEEESKNIIRNLEEETLKEEKPTEKADA